MICLLQTVLCGESVIKPFIIEISVVCDCETIQIDSTHTGQLLLIDHHWLLSAQCQNSNTHQVRVSADY